MNKVNIPEQLGRIDSYWDPQTVGELNGQLVKLAKFKGEFVWHAHDNEDELFLVVQGSFDLEFRDHTVRLGEGDMYIVPKGVEHRPVAREEVSVMLFEPASTLKMGNATPRTEGNHSQL